MAWYNSLSDFWGDAKSIASGHNPMNQAPPVNIPAKPSGIGTTAPGMAPNAPYTGQKVSTNSDDPSDASSSYWDDPSNPYGASGDSGFVSGLTDAIKAGGSAALDWIKAHPQDILSLVAAYNQHQRQGQADGYAKAGLALATNEYNDPTGKGALRLAGTSGMLNPNAKTPDLSSLQSLAGPNSGNPFTKALPLAQLNHGTPGSIPTTSTPAPSPLPLTGIPNPPSLAPGQQTGLPPTIPVGMQPPPGWTPPKALALAPDPNAPKVA